MKQNPIDDLNWRYATKRFDPTKIIDETTLNTLLEVIRMAPSSYGLQPTKVLVVKNPEIRTQLVSAAYGQQQVADASHLLVLCSHTNLSEALIHSFIAKVAEVREQDLQSLAGFEKMLLNFAEKNSPEMLSVWMKKQNYIVLGHLLQVCAQMRIDSTPMEGFNAKEFDRILNLEERGLKTDLVVPIGNRHPEDPYLHKKKVRRTLKDIVEIID